MSATLWQMHYRVSPNPTQGGITSCMHAESLDPKKPKVLQVFRIPFTCMGSKVKQGPIRSMSYHSSFEGAECESSLGFA
eukprot:5344602-Amphidinium_carterae.1